MEEDPLIQCLLGIVNEGWKADNGFKAGFQRELEKAMRKLIPSTDIVATPHINSKIHIWKKEYGALSGLLSKSGIGWNSTTHTLDIVDETVWDAQKMADPTVRSMRNKSYPYYDKWLDIFGKDRATGEHVTDPIDLVNEMLKSDHEQEGETDGNPAFGTHEIDKNKTSVCKTSASGAQNFKGKKRKSVEFELT
ncbi:hypothetical protein ACS0TY_020399 [Phlomoides rotata]